MEEDSALFASLICDGEARTGLACPRVPAPNRKKGPRSEAKAAGVRARYITHYQASVKPKPYDSNSAEPFLQPEVLGP